MNIIKQNLAIEKINHGYPIIFQTDTLPAIGCLPSYSEIIYKTKKRDKKKPLILMGAETCQVEEYVHKSALQDYKSISSQYWPGALTMIIPISNKKKSIVTSSNLTIGIRVPNSLMAKSLIKETGPLLTSSANLSGVNPKKTAEEVSLNMPGIDILGPVPWDECSGEASTIIFWVKKGKWKLIRKGKVHIPEVA